MSPDAAPERAIVAFHQDGDGDWVAQLECGHGQHVRHDPPWQARTWVTSESGRRGMLGLTVPCEMCRAEIAERGAERPPSAGRE